jgi:hypothetical protein
MSNIRIIEIDSITGKRKVFDEGDTIIGAGGSAVSPFELDSNGDIQMSDAAGSVELFELDSNGDIQSKE